MRLELHDVGAVHPAARAGARAALAGLNLCVAEGEQIAVIGPSGAGKTSFLQLLGCALPPASGQLRLDGDSPWQLPRRQLQALRGRLFLAPQVPPLPPRQRVVTSVLAGRLPAMGLWASLRSWVHPSDLPAAFEALASFDLGDKLFERVDRLSGGERQRVGLARALLSPAALWLLDEPLSALDPTRARQAMAVMQQQARARHVTLVASLHQVDVALRCFPRVLGLREGRLLFDRPAAEVGPAELARLYEQHEHELQGGASEPEAASAPWLAGTAGLSCR